MPNPITQNPNYNAQTQWMNVEQRQAARNTPIANTPIAWVAPQPSATPSAYPEASSPMQSDGHITNANNATPTTNQTGVTNAQIHADNVLARQNTPTTTPSGATMNQNGTITNPTPTPVTTPATPVTTTTPKVETPLVVPQEQKTNEMVAHLNDWLRNSPSLFADQNTFRNAYWYAQKSPQEQAVLDNFYNNARPNKDTMFGQFVQWTPPKQASSPEYVNAQKQFQKLQPFLNTSDPNSIVNAASNGTLTNDDLSKIQQYAPWVYQAYQTAKEGTQKANVINGATWIPTKSVAETVTDYLQNISNQVMKNTPQNLVDAYAQYVQQDPRVSTALSDVQLNRQKVAEYNAQRSNIENEIRTQYPNLNEWAVQSLIFSRTKQMNYGATLAESELQNSLSYLNESTTLAKGSFDAYQTQYQNNFNLGNEAFQTSLGQNNQAFTANLGLQQSQAQFEQGIKQKIQTANDPYLATQSMVDMYKGMWVMPQRSTQEIYQQVQKDMAGWATLGQALSTVNAQFQQNPSYPTAINKALGVSFEPKPIYGMNGVVVWYQTYNMKTGKYETTNFAWGGLPWQQGSGWFLPIISVTRNGTNIWQDTNNPWNIMADTPQQQQYAKSLWAIWAYQSPNGRTYAVFPDMTTGQNALAHDLQSKMTWGSSWVTPTTTLAQLATGWTSWPNAQPNQSAIENYVNLTGFSANTPISQIPMDILSKAIVSNEWVDISKSAKIETPTWNKELKDAIDTLITYWGDIKNTPTNMQWGIDDILKRNNKSIAWLEDSLKTLNAIAGWKWITAIDHLNMLSEFANNTANGVTTTDTALLNKWKAWTGNTDVTNVDLMASLASEEIGKAYWAGTGSEKEWLLNTLKNGTKEQKLAAIQQAKQALSDMYTNANNSYKTITGEDHPDFVKLEEKVAKKTDTTNMANITPEVNTAIDNFLAQRNK